MRRTTALLTIILAMAVSYSGCGGKSSKKAASSSKAKSANESASQQQNSTTTAAGAQGAAKANAKSASATQNATTATTRAIGPGDTVVGMPSYFTVQADKPCVHPEDTQGFTVKGGTPRSILIYDTAYSNGTDDYTSNYGSGSGDAKFDDSGNYHGTYVLAGNVPPGTAYLSVATSHGGQLIQARTTFLIKPITERC